MNAADLSSMVIEHGKLISAMNEQIKGLIQQQETKKMVESTQSLAMSVQELVIRTEDLEQRLKSMEGKHSQRLNTLWVCSVTGVMGALITYLMSRLLGT